MLMKQGSIILVDFSYSNLKEAKFRPALVISNSEYNEDSIDIVVLRVTSRGRDRKWDIEILKNDIAAGTIDIEPSYIKIDSLYTVEKNIIRKVVARLKEGKIKEIRQKLLELFS
ncbi:MAG: type II toxin-antitoxin system PemK/MazF family toxin [Candidatus Methanoperedens sp.]|nr:type II toxin-antitoxin system PemK/MazF family toxin [Candidatus Methanoperedens sp.]MCE8429053.1 type II toxin-antitoxin system PemK/MazF family toxin [Candidatus Methanoperedens sp.]